MSETASNEFRISIDEKISSDEKIPCFDIKNQHRGKKIDKVVFSPKNKYFATASFHDRSVCMWEFKQETGELKLSPYHFFNLKETVLCNPICVSDFNKILIGNTYNDYYILEIRDCNNQEGGIGEKLLDSREHDGDVVNCGFLTNGDFAIVEGNPTYQAHIFSFIGGKWHSTSKIRLVEFKHAAVSHDRVLILMDLPFVIIQWNLLTRKFEKQYELDWSLAKYQKDILMELSCDQKILAVAGRLNGEQEEDSNTNHEEDLNTKHEEDLNTKLEENSRVYFYSTESGTIIGNQSFNEKFSEKKKTSISKILFIKFEKEEFLFIYFGQEKTSYAITPPTSSSSSLKLHSLPNSPSESKNSGKLHLPGEIDFILQYQLNNEHNELEDDLHSFKEENQKEDSRDENGVYSPRKDIKNNIDKFLKIYKSKNESAKQSSTHRSLTQDSEKQVTLRGNQYIWTVKETSHNNMLAAKIIAKWTANEISVEELAKYLKKLDVRNRVDVENNEISSPRLSSTIIEIFNRERSKLRTI
ncbi:4616_t:CDS:2 [Acaulospora morrowiae]|uniref:4616_t:CDS:1 n=1 Tax=Acaulospora morrowiae TaxID=94023 RepID=A0A9N8VG96_9GLOM|nr:4616_t:CDS:2 [Acaulospora morrowiae]